MVTVPRSVRAVARSSGMCRVPEGRGLRRHRCAPQNKDRWQRPNPEHSAELRCVRQLEVVAGVCDGKYHHGDQVRRYGPV